MGCSGGAACTGCGPVLGIAGRPEPIDTGRGPADTLSGDAVRTCGTTTGRLHLKHRCWLALSAASSCSSSATRACRASTLCIFFCFSLLGLFGAAQLLWSGRAMQVSGTWCQNRVADEFFFSSPIHRPSSRLSSAGSSRPRPRTTSGSCAGACCKG
jgi:hypothetical protein